MCRLPAGRYNVIVALGIAGSPVGLLALFFVDPWRSGSLMRLAAAAGLFWLRRLRDLREHRPASSCFAGDLPSGHTLMDGKDSIMWKWLTVLSMLLLGSQQTLGQVNIRPETVPRLPPQPGQSLPLADQQFLGRAANLSEAEIKAGRLGAEKASSLGLKEISQQLTADHQKLRQSVQELAQKPFLDHFTIYARHLDHEEGEHGRHHQLPHPLHPNVHDIPPIKLVEGEIGGV